MAAVICAPPAVCPARRLPCGRCHPAAQPTGCGIGSQPGSGAGLPCAL